MVGLSAHGLRIINMAFLLVGMQMVSTTFFQCLGMVRKSIFLSLTRQLLFLIPLVYLLPRWWGIAGVWCSFPLSDLLSFTITGIMILSLMRKFKTLEDGADPAILGGYKG
jgi:Na+-driven multidrug efflux pump